METFTTHLDWTGALHGATRDHVGFSRNLEITAAGRSIPMSSAPQFRGDASRLNPEQLFVAAISACHALTYLFLAGRAGVHVVGYTDAAEGTLALVDGKRRMSRVVLRPHIVLEAGTDAARARDLIDQAHQGCFIGNSVSSEIAIEPAFSVGGRQATAA